MSQTNIGISRRRFGQRTAALAALLPAAAQAQRPQGAPLTDSETGEAEARYQEAMRRYGSRLSDAQKQRIHGVLTANERMLSHIREFPLANGDTPATVLKLAEGAPNQPAVSRKAK